MFTKIYRLQGILTRLRGLVWGAKNNTQEEKEMAKFENYDKLRNAYSFLEEYRYDDGGEGWHKNYKRIADWINVTRGNIWYDEKFELGKEYNLLRKIIYDKDNGGVANPGQSLLAKTVFDSMLGDKDFIRALKHLIEEPSEGNYKAFAQEWWLKTAELGKNNNPLRVNRVAAACTQNVTTVVDETIFNEIFYWMMDEGLIRPCPEDMDENWFTRNNHVMNCLREAFSAELDSGETDIFYLSQFVWYLNQRWEDLLEDKWEDIMQGTV